MIKVYAYYHIEDDNKYAVVHLGKVWASSSELLRRSTDITISMYKIFGKWLDENSKTYKLDVEYEWSDDDSVTLKPFVSFEDESEAMAFKLRWT